MNDRTTAQQVTKAADDAVDAAKDAAKDVAAGATQMLKTESSMARESIAAAIDGTTEAASGAVRAASEAVSDRVDQVTRSSQDLADDAAALIQRYPVRSALIAAGFVAVAGVVVGYLVGRRS